jgi:hypothetical protein
LTPRDPSPSRLAYRLHRLWLTPAVRIAVKAGLPALVLAGAIVATFADEGRRAAIAQTLRDARLAFENRPEFQVRTLSVDSETPAVASAIAERMALELPVSSFHLDMDRFARARRGAGRGRKRPPAHPRRRRARGRRRRSACRSWSGAAATG